MSENQLIRQDASLFEWIEPYIKLQKNKFELWRNLTIKSPRSVSRDKAINEGLKTILNKNKLTLARVPGVELAGGWRGMKWVLLQDNIKIAELNDG
jgi:hypothetical protein